MKIEVKHLDAIQTLADAVRMLAWHVEENSKRLNRIGADEEIRSVYEAMEELITLLKDQRSE